MLRIVLDTNTFVSSLLVQHGLPAEAVDAWRERRYVLATSPAVISEIRSTLRYPRIRRKYAITDDDVDRLVALLERDALVVPHCHGPQVHEEATGPKSLTAGRESRTPDGGGNGEVFDRPAALG